MRQSSQRSNAFVFNGLAAHHPCCHPTTTHAVSLQHTTLVGFEHLLRYNTGMSCVVFVDLS